MKVGYGKACITPPLGTPCARGIGSALKEVLDDTYVRALWVQVGKEGVLIASADLLGIYPNDADGFARAISKATGIREDHIILHATHSHESGGSRWEPAEVLRPYGINEDYASSAYKKQVEEGFVEAAKQAVASSVPCKMAYAEASVKDIASNRRVPIDDKGNVRFRSSRPPQEMRDAPEGPIDPTLRMVLFRSDDGKSTLGFCNYNCHPSCAGGDEAGYVTGDFPYAGIDEIEKEMPGVHLVHITGTSAEINPGKYVSNNSTDPAERKKDIAMLGRRYADAIRAAMRSASGWKDADNLKLQWRKFGFHLRRDEPPVEEYRKKTEEEAKLYKEEKAAGKTVQTHFHPMIYRYYTLLEFPSGIEPTRAAAMRLGDVWFTFMPGEIFMQFGSTLREKFGNSRLVNVSCCFDYAVGYVIPADAYDRGGYEPGATRLAKESYDKLMSDMTALLDEVK